MDNLQTTCQKEGTRTVLQQRRAPLSYLAGTQVTREEKSDVECQEGEARDEGRRDGVVGVMIKRYETGPRSMYISSEIAASGSTSCLTGGQFPAYLSLDLTTLHYSHLST